MAENLFLSIDGIEIEDCEEGDYTAYEEELGVSERMISGRRIEELRATVWVVELSLDAISGEVMQKLSQAFKERRQHELFFLPPDGGKDLVSGIFHLVERPTPKLSKWWSEYPVWDKFDLKFEEINGHD